MPTYARVGTADQWFGFGFRVDDVGILPSLVSCLEIDALGRIFFWGCRFCVGFGVTNMSVDAQRVILYHVPKSNFHIHNWNVALASRSRVGSPIEAPRRELIAVVCERARAVAKQCFPCGGLWAWLWLLEKHIENVKYKKFAHYTILLLLLPPHIHEDSLNLT